jgi:hypothetical protein
VNRHFASRPRVLAALVGLCWLLCDGCTNVMEDRATRTDLLWGVPREALTQ